MNLEKIVINTSGTVSDIFVGRNWHDVSSMINGREVVIITDDNVAGIYGKDFPDCRVLSVEPGEESKKLEVIEKLSRQLLDANIDREGFILAIGGGVVCDIAGFLASVYMRGIHCAYISTSLLSQVDASTGGKNGVNLNGIKNMIGTFRQPEFVICDTAMLKTLPEVEYLSGLAELIKTGIIGDEEIIDIIENNIVGVLGRDIEILTDLITHSVRFKASVVSVDEKESGLRRILNFGHTYGHAIEMYESLPHGLAVASGMEIATYFSFEKGLLNSVDKNRIIKLLVNLNLLSNYNVPETELKQLITHDEKKSGSGISFVFIEGIGKAIIEKVSVTDLVDFSVRFKELKTSSL